ncbi:hypothetical protein QL285_019151 [Trifolium repens]|nr:hypothetical protein QL285_045930 [Trifolium repens]KAK2433951.1 hypothetical protein QL285_019151 [Trifolium repens]
MNQFRTLLIRVKSPWSSANQEQTLMTRGRSHEDPIGPAKHVPRMDQSRGKPPWSSANQEQTLVTRDRLLEDPAESVKHVSEWLNLGAYLSERENQYQ